MSEAQTDLFVQPRHTGDADVTWLEGLLRRDANWVTSRQCIALLGKVATDDNRRWIRELASQSTWIISGQKGYKHIEHSTPEEIQHAASWLESQAKKMGERAGGIRANAHKIFAGKI